MERIVTQLEIGSIPLSRMFHIMNAFIWNQHGHTMMPGNERSDKWLAIILKKKSA